MINAIIMASGYSKRMGKDKLLMPFRDKLLAEYIMEKVISCNFYSSIIVSKDERILNIATKKGLKAVENKNAYKGQSESIKLGINSTPIADGYMFFTADQPLISIDTIKLLINTFNKYDSCNIVIPRIKNRRGNPVIFPKKLIGELMSLEGDNGGKNVINKHTEDIIFVDIKDEYELTDIDTYEDYKKLLAFNDRYDK
ncbi:molybdenum cofactor cytidylyltransferase [Clostridiaceae bacterium UIB06]|uniref:Molybdenum cofactor cytidylyltransferase n=1 Tax=Clostridium thailandense TaxID=2794346 RepID=A0A949TRK9_9CLOT|nr:molybdenum cofactor cytidylyltransferase [Clostridium thailandense]MBV7272021.1 molybdenum cofactor cytidylyltransferase [Clostridium thailandense]MCH5137419.1 molybdenum cofactor cytidylyltransferase [Clostridiaceae bacterium UIB06]